MKPEKLYSVDDMREVAEASHYRVRWLTVLSCIACSALIAYLIMELVG